MKTKQKQNNNYQANYNEGVNGVPPKSVKFG